MLDKASVNLDTAVALAAAEAKATVHQELYPKIQAAFMDGMEQAKSMMQPMMQPMMQSAHMHGQSSGSSGYGHGGAGWSGTRGSMGGSRSQTPTDRGGGGAYADYGVPPPPKTGIVSEVLL